MEAKREYSVEIDGQSYKLAWDFGEICLAERAIGCNLLYGLAALLLNTATAEQFLGLFYAGYRAALPPAARAKVTLSQVAGLIRIETMPDIRDALLEAYGAGRRKDEQAGGPPPPQAPSAGETGAEGPR